MNKLINLGTIKMIEKKKEEKPWYKSKTLWINLIAILAMFVQGEFDFIISANEQVSILAVVNLILRAFTDSGIEKKLR